MDHDADSKVETEYNDDDVFKVRVSIPHLKCDLELGVPEKPWYYIGK